MVGPSVATTVDIMFFCYWYKAPLRKSEIITTNIQHIEMFTIMVVEEDDCILGCSTV
jgi:hypothetical protein